MTGEALSSVSVSGLITMDLHSLNNEGGEGNQIQTRMVHIVDGEGKLAVVNAVSGDMLKHIQSEHFQAIANGGAELKLCGGCRRFSANRINDDGVFMAALGDVKENAEILDRVLRSCAMDDVEGILITMGNRSTPRKSVVEFGWLVGLPDRTRTERYFHVKYDMAGRGEGSGGETGANVGQNIFYRPASSGVYAAIVNVDLHRVGFNDISREYAVEEHDRRRRQRVLLESLTYTFLKPNGALRNTQNPHITDFRGVVSWSTGFVPAPMVSGLVGDVGKLREETDRIAAGLNRLNPGSVGFRAFEGLGDFATAMAELVDRV
ncbi:MAG: DevR family CRISPR-associated autoregulator [Chloroflexi bacterium]|nr:DevR family CRISPR-associated autoregulator [Chloroflexota bacterium]